MDFTKVLTQVVSALDTEGIHYALIGGLAMAARGVQRATLDIDFILLLDDLEQTHRILIALGYQRDFHSENVSHYQSPDPSSGRIDLLHAFRGPTLGMLDRAEKISMSDGLSLPVIHIEDLIGLKTQAAVNDPSRHRKDWNDIYMLVEHAARVGTALDWDLIADYLSLFQLESNLTQLKELYGQTQSKGA